MLNKILKKVKLEKPVNAKTLESLLLGIGAKISDFGYTVHIKRDSYLIKVTNQVCLDKLIALTDPTESRADATTRLRDSHKHGTDTAYFVYKTFDKPVRHGAIFCGTGTDLAQAWPNAENTCLVLIENSDCFTFSDIFLNVMGLNNLDAGTLVIWSSGKNITHKQAIRLLGAFKKTFYCPDYDLAGIEVFETLSKSLSGKLEFCMPAQLDRFARYCKKPENQTHFTRALAKAREHGFTEMVSLLEKGLGILEQEALLIEGPSNH